MAVSAFKSTSRRGNLGDTGTSLSSSSSSIASSSTPKGEGSDNTNKKIHRRSRSVSATSRLQNSSSFDDFINKRDNPLFNSSPPDVTPSKNLNGVSIVNQNVSKLEKSPSSKLVGNGVGDGRRGRSVSRSSDSGNQLAHGRKAMGQSLSRLDTGRRHRSVSRVRKENSESGNEDKYNLPSTLRNKNIRNSSIVGQKTINATRDLELSSGTRNLQTWSSQHPLSEPLDNFSACSRADYREDATSTSSFSEAEEKTILAFTEQLKSFQSDPSAGDVERDSIYETVRSEVRRAINEIQGGLENVIQQKDLTAMVNPDAVELVSEIRSEYGAKLKQAQERARKLRADLAVEEHREQEFSRILEEVLPEPNNPQPQKSRPRRKTSMERRKMSKRLTEEAMNYFDECVSISTFDGSDFSSVEDPVSNLVLPDPPIDDHMFSPSTSSSTFVGYHLDDLVNNNKGLDEKSQSMLNHSDSELSSNRDSLYRYHLTDSIAPQNKKFGFSLTREPCQANVISHEMGSFIKMFEKDIRRDDKDHRVAGPSYREGVYCELPFPDERLLLEKVIHRNRIESGVFLLCDIWT